MSHAKSEECDKEGEQDLAMGSGLSFLTAWWLGSKNDHTKKEEVRDASFSGFGS